MGGEFQPLAVSPSQDAVIVFKVLTLARRARAAIGNVDLDVILQVRQ